MGFEEGSIVFDRPTGTYYPGEDVSGRLVFELVNMKDLRGIKIRLKGFCKVSWRTTERRKQGDRHVNYHVDHESYEEYVNSEMYVVGSSDGKISMTPGKYEYPFSFRLPGMCPSSFEGSHGHVRYDIKAVADRAFKMDQEIRGKITVASIVDLNHLNCAGTANIELSQSYCCWCVSAGSSYTRVSAPWVGFVPGQEVPLEFSCRNPSSVKLENITIKVQQTTMYTATTNSGHKEECETLTSMSGGSVEPHTDRNWTVVLRMPQLPVYSLRSCSYIDVRYALKVIVEPDGCHSDDESRCAIEFGTVPLQGSGVPPPPGPLPHTVFPPPVVHQPLAQAQVPAFNAPYPGQHPSPYPNQAPNPYPQPYPGATSPYPNTTSPYPNTTSPYPNTTSPYPNATSPYPNTTSPYPTTNSPYPASAAPYPANPGQNVSPYPPNPSPYPAPSPYPVNDVLVKSENPRSRGASPVPMPAPALPPGVVPYPPNTSPFATASAPGPATPDTDLKNPGYDANSSPFNPDFLNSNKK